MDDEIFDHKSELDSEVARKAKDEDLSLDEAEELQDLVDETGLDADDAFELWQEM